MNCLFQKRTRNVHCSRTSSIFKDNLINYDNSTKNKCVSIFHHDLLKPTKTAGALRVCSCAESSNHQTIKRHGVSLQRIQKQSVKVQKGSAADTWWICLSSMKTNDWWITKEWRNSLNHCVVLESRNVRRSCRGRVLYAFHEFKKFKSTNSFCVLVFLNNTHTLVKWSNKARSGCLIDRAIFTQPTYTKLRLTMMSMTKARVSKSTKRRRI